MTKNILCVLFANMCLFVSADFVFAQRPSSQFPKNGINVLQRSIWDRCHIYVCWENGSNSHREKQWVKNAIRNTWEKYSSLSFLGWQSCSLLRGHKQLIRILIKDSHPHTKGLGRALSNIRNGMVLNFTFRKWNPLCRKRRQQCITGIAIHEFGHALALSHGHNRLDTPSTCTEKKQGTNGDTYIGRWDAMSVMNYCNPTPYYAIKLSKEDIKGIQKIYGTKNFGCKRYLAQASNKCMRSIRRKYIKFCGARLKNVYSVCKSKIFRHKRIFLTAAIGVRASMAICAARYWYSCMKRVLVSELSKCLTHYGFTSTAIANEVNKQRCFQKCNINLTIAAESIRGLIQNNRHVFTKRNKEKLQEVYKKYYLCRGHCF